MNYNYISIKAIIYWYIGRERWSGSDRPRLLVAISTNSVTAEAGPGVCEVLATGCAVGSSSGVDFFSSSSSSSPLPQFCCEEGASNSTEECEQRRLKVRR